jgi:uncharacterized membrane protein (UPF0127 family)
VLTYANGEQLALYRTDGAPVCTARVASSFFARLRGLLGRRALRAGEGLLLRPEWSVHTLFMRFPIDVVFLDEHLTVVGVVPRLRPFRCAGRRGAAATLELAAGEAERLLITAGETFGWGRVSAAGGAG